MDFLLDEGKFYIDATGDVVGPMRLVQSKDGPFNIYMGYSEGEKAEVPYTLDGFCLLGHNEEYQIVNEAKGTADTVFSVGDVVVRSGHKERWIVMRDIGSDVMVRCSGGEGDVVQPMIRVKKTDISKAFIDPDSDEFSVFDVYAGYSGLIATMWEAIDQAALGKGKEGHSNGDAYEDQPWAQITDLAGLGFPVGQAMKKLREALGMINRGKHRNAHTEVLDAVIYAASAALHISDKHSLRPVNEVEIDEEYEDEMD